MDVTQRACSIQQCGRCLVCGSSANHQFSIYDTLKACRYVRSMVSAQLGGEDKQPNTLGQCAPQNYVNQQAGFEGLPDDAAINPCGLVAHSYFNDSFTISTQQPGGAATPVTLDVSSLTYLKFGLAGALSPSVSAIALSRLFGGIFITWLSWQIMLQSCCTAVGPAHLPSLLPVRILFEPCCAAVTPSMQC